MTKKETVRQEEFELASQKVGPQFVAHIAQPYSCRALRAVESEGAHGSVCQALTWDIFDGDLPGMSPAEAQKFVTGGAPSASSGSGGTSLPAAGAPAIKVPHYCYIHTSHVTHPFSESHMWVGQVPSPTPNPSTVGWVPTPSPHRCALQSHEPCARCTASCRMKPWQA